MSEKKVDHTNIFESWVAQDVFVADILEKIATDWKRVKIKHSEFNRENLEEFLYEEFPCWIECGLQDFLDDEFGEEDGDEE